MAPPNEKNKIEWFTPKGNGNSQGNVTEGVDLESRSDLSDTSIKSLGSYLSELTSKNYYSVDPPDGLPQTYYTKDTLGTNPPTQPEVGAESFIEDVPPDAKAYFDTISIGQAPGEGGGGALGPASELLLGGKNNQKSGNNVLSDIEGDDWPTTLISTDSTPGTKGNERLVRELVQNTVLKYNRWNPVAGDTPYIEDRQYSHGMYTNQDDLGRYRPDSEKQVELDALKRVAINMLIRSAGGAGNSESAASDLITDSGAIPVSLGFEQVSVINLRPIAQVDYDKALKNLSEPAKYLGNSDWLDNDAAQPNNSMSWGQLNTPLVQFQGLLPIGMIAIASTAALAMLIAGVVVGLIFDLLAMLGFGTDAVAHWALGGHYGEEEYGEFSGPSQIIKSVLNLPILQATASYTKAMIFGLSAFFEMLQDGLSAGYFAVVARNAIRDLKQIEEAGKSMSEVGGDPVGAIEGIFLVLGALTASATYKFLLTMIKIGDISNAAGANWFKDGPYPLEPSRETIHASAEPRLDNLHKKSKKISGEKGLAWSNSMLPAAILLPSAMRNVGRGVGASILKMPAQAFSGQEDAKSGDPYEGNELKRFPKLRTFAEDVSRISQDEVRWIESQLNTTYMPFYFHDLRTNEIVSFFAFVESISDDWSPSWSQVGGIGRMDQVQIYKNTTRTLGVTFTIASLNKEDFDEMYVRINRLVAMVYPQWSAGMIRRFTDAGAGDVESFIQPFSQIPTASPVIRLRLGDLFKSNYTTKNMRRLFGDGDEKLLSFKDASQADADKLKADVEAELENVLDTQMLSAKATGELPSTADAVAANAQIAGGLPPSINYPQPGWVYTVPILEDGYRRVVEKAPGVFKMPLVMGLGIPRTYTPEDGEYFIVRGYYYQMKINAGSAPPSKRRAKKAQISGGVKIVFSPIKARDNKEVKKDPDGDEIMFAVDFSKEIKLDQDQAKVKIASALAGVSSPFNPDAEIDFSDLAGAKEREAFFNPENNSIVRSFESAGGQGIAGVITQLGFDWNEAPWEIEPGSRAPMWCKVSLGFTPIHDIPLGIDYQGGMRAPAYNVGTANNQLFGAGPYPNVEGTNPADLAAKNFKEMVDQAADQPSWWAKMRGKEEKQKKGD